MNANSTRNVVVEAGGGQVVGHVGLHGLGSFADQLGVDEAVSQAVGWHGRGVPVHEPGSGADPSDADAGGWGRVVRRY